MFYLSCNLEEGKIKNLASKYGDICQETDKHGRSKDPTYTHLQSHAALDASSQFGTKVASILSYTA